jgi:UDP-N-acetylglucosamine acyltransferase
VFHPFSVIGGEPQARPLATPTRPGTLEIGADNIFREHVTVSVSCEDLPTRIGSQNLLMAGVHVAHDVTVGSHCVIANGVQLAGHVVLEDWVTFGGLSGVAQHCRVGESAFVAAGAMCERNVPPFVIVQGDRARVRALNTVGLERRGVPRASVANLREAFALTFGHRDDGVSFDEAVRRLDLRDPYVDTFARALSTRG